MNIGLLARYGIGSVELFPPYGVDTGNGLGAGLVLGFESKKSYFGFTGEYIFGAENGNIIALVGDGSLTGGMAYEALNNSSITFAAFVSIIWTVAVK